MTSIFLEFVRSIRDKQPNIVCLYINGLYIVHVVKRWLCSIMIRLSGYADMLGLLVKIS